MQTVAEIITPYRGSEATCEMVREQIRERYGDEAADEFDPHTDAAPYASWISYGYRVKRGEKALKSVTFIEAKDGHGNVERKIRRTVNLFHKFQVERML